MKIIITGGCGFIGTNMVTNLINNDDIEKIYVIDCMTYASNLVVPRLGIHDCTENNWSKVEHINKDIRHIRNCESGPTLSPEIYDVDFCIHLAAESHVDKSLDAMKHFTDVNAFGTYEVSRFCFENDIKMIHFSTDEVYGELPLHITDFDRFNEITTKPKPRNPYSVSKYFAEHMIDLAEIETGVYNNCIKIRPCNQFGSYQDKTKLLPKLIMNIKSGIRTPIYGTGENVREWMFIEDTVRVIEELMFKWHMGCPVPSILNLGSGNDVYNVSMVGYICDIMNTDIDSAVEYVDDPRGNCHDKRYAVDSNKMQRYMGNEFEYTTLIDGLKQTVEWYTKNK